jgi:hypothetical protein
VLRDWKNFRESRNMPEPLLGIVLVGRQASSQADVLIQVRSTAFDAPDGVFGLNMKEFAKFVMPAAWLMNRKLDFEILDCRRSYWEFANEERGEQNTLRFISYPCECLPHSIPRSAEGEDISKEPPSLTTAFNIVFVLDSTVVDEETCEIYWQCISTLSRAIISEEDRSYYLSRQVLQLQQGLVTPLEKLLSDAFDGLRSSERSASLYVNDSVLTHVSVIPFGLAPQPPRGYQSLVLTCDPEELQRKLPVDSASNLRRLLDAADPTKTIKDHMIELGLPVSTIQRISQHLTYWKMAKIVHTLHKKTVLILSSHGGVKPSDEILNQFSSKFKSQNSKNIFLKIIHLFSRNKNLAEVKDDIFATVPTLHNRFSELCSFLLSKNIVEYSEQYFRYFPPISVGGTKRLLPGSFGSRPKFQNQLPHEIRSQFSPIEFEVIFERLKYNSIGAELMVKLIANYVKRHKDLITARIELNEQCRCTNDDFNKFTEALMSSGYMDSLLVKYEV